METKTVTAGMLEEVTLDMRLDWPGKRRGEPSHRAVSRGGEALQM
jgi:hypothetical protein